MSTLDGLDSFPLATADTDYSADNRYEGVLYCDALQIGEFTVDSKWEEHINVERHRVRFKLDTGA